MWHLLLGAFAGSFVTFAAMTVAIVLCAGREEEDNDDEGVS